MRRLLFILMVVTLFSCTKEYTIVPPISYTDFNGTYIVEIEHSILQDQYDSIGNYLGVFRKSEFFTDTIIMDQLALTDSVMITGLRHGRSKSNLDDRIVADSILLDHDWTTPTFSDCLRGSIGLLGDSLFIDYEWNKFDTWSTSVRPFMGRVTGKGSR